MSHDFSPNNTAGFKIVYNEPNVDFIEHTIVIAGSLILNTANTGSYLNWLRLKSIV